MNSTLSIEKKNLHMSEFVCDRERRRQSVVLHDRTRGPLAHGSQLGQPQRVALHLVPADLLPGQQEGRVVVEVRCLLDATERLQHFRCRYAWNGKGGKNVELNKGNLSNNDENNDSEPTTSVWSNFHNLCALSNSSHYRTSSQISLPYAYFMIYKC